MCDSESASADGDDDDDDGDNGDDATASGISDDDLLGVDNKTLQRILVAEVCSSFSLSDIYLLLV